MIHWQSKLVFIVIVALAIAAAFGYTDGCAW